MFSVLARWLLRRVYADLCAGRTRLIELTAADDVTLVFPGRSSFSGTFRGKPELLSWLRRFAQLGPSIDVVDVVAGGAPWNLRIAVRLDDAIGADYRNNVTELLWVRWGRLRRLEVFLDTQRLAAWDERPVAATAG